MAELTMYQITLDGTWHGSRVVPKTWVARIDGTHEVMGLDREFITPKNDWAGAKVTGKGNRYGVVATFPLRDGHIYEAHRARGTASRRAMVREYFWLEGGEVQELDDAEALDKIQGYASTLTWRMRDNPEDRPTIAEVLPGGRRNVLGWTISEDARRCFCLRDGLHQVHEKGRTYWCLVTDGDDTELTDEEAAAWLAAHPG